MQVNFNSFIPVSTCDWYGRASAVVFFNECNFRCSLCHNKQTWNEINIMNIEDIKDMIKFSMPFISAVTFSGGEPYIQFDALKELVEYSKSIGLGTAVETNGYFTDEIKELQVDKLFIDVKAPIDDEIEYFNVTGVIDSSKKVRATLNLSLSAEIRIVNNLNSSRITKSLEGKKHPVRILPFNKEG